MIKIHFYLVTKHMALQIYRAIDPHLRREDFDDETRREILHSSWLPMRLLINPQTLRDFRNWVTDDPS